MTEHDLDSLFAEARAEVPLPSAALTARVLADADALMPQSPGFAPRVAVVKPSLWSVVVAALGGGGALAGMTTAAVAGLWVGFAQPVGEGLFASVLGNETTTIDMMPGIDALIEETP